MLKFTLLFLTGFLSIFPSQDIEYPINENGKYSFSEVVELPGLNRDQLFKNGEKFMKKIKVLNSKKKFHFKDELDYSMSNRGSFYVYRIGSIKKAIDGAVEYDITLEFKDGKYRYTITNFIFHEYHRNRYGKYEPINGKYIPLEMNMTSLNKKEWERHKEVVYQKTQALIANLYSEMVQVDTPKLTKTTKEDNW